MVGSSTNVVRVDAFFAFKKSHKPKEPKILVSLPAPPPPYTFIFGEKQKAARHSSNCALLFPNNKYNNKIKKKCPTSYMHYVCLSSVRLSEDFFLYFFLFTFLYFLLPPPEFPYCLYYICPSSVSLLEFFFQSIRGT